MNKAKQFVACNQDGYVIGDGILFFLDENKVSLVGRPSAHNWVQYHAETGGYDVTFERDERTAVEPDRAAQALPLPGAGPERARRCSRRRTAGRCPRSSSSTWASSRSRARKVRALHHGMSGVPGLELFGPWEDGEDVRAAIVEAGEEFGL